MRVFSWKGTLLLLPAACLAIGKSGAEAVAAFPVEAAQRRDSAGGLDCAPLKEKLSKLKRGIADIAGAKIQIEVLVRTDWSRLFGGSHGGDPASGQAVNASLQDNQKLLLLLEQAGEKLQGELQQLASSECPQQASSRADLTRQNDPGLGIGLQSNVSGPRTARENVSF